MRILNLALKNTIFSETMALGLAMFSMFFGAGNVIFPLAVGQYAGDQNLTAIFGLILTAAVIPIVGVFGMILFEGRCGQFFGRLGKWPGFLLALVIISLLGPLGSTPRCIALAYTTFTHACTTVSPVLFSALACLVIFAFTVRKTHTLTMLGWVLTPVLLISLVTLIVTGFLKPHELTSKGHTQLNIFMHGLKEGYNTMDLLAAFFFSSTIFTSLRNRHREMCEKSHRQIALRASILGACLLAVIYIGFSYLAAFQGNTLNSYPKDELLTAIALKLAGDRAGLLVCVTVTFACLTTAIALIMAFCEFVQKEVFLGKVSYEKTLIFSLVATFFVSTFEFSGISVYLGPILQICYPGLIVLTFLNIAYCLKQFKPIKVPVWTAFTLSALLYFYH